MERKGPLEAWVGQQVLVRMQGMKGDRRVRLQDVNEFGIVVENLETREPSFFPWSAVYEVKPLTGRQP